MAASCDTFVVLPKNTTKNVVIFGKNSDRPQGEVQEVVYFPKKTNPEGSSVQCTYIQIEEAPEVYGVILSKPAWMWGAEMGANDQGVVIGNEAVWAKVKAGHKDEMLLGMDLVRLGLERGATARGALDVIVSLLERHGQGGPCSDSDPEFCYFNSYLIADPKEAYVLETVDKHWVAEKVEKNFRNISNCLTIGTKIDLKSKGLEEYAKSNGLWNGSDEFNFTQVFSSHENELARFKAGSVLLDKYSKDKKFDVSSMMTVLRDEPSGICRDCTDPFPTASSQVSVLSSNASRPSCHWFTGTPDAVHSVFKPFIFCDNITLTSTIKSPEYEAHEDPAKIKPRFSKRVDRRHALYKLHEARYDRLTHAKEGAALRGLLKEVEETCVKEVEEMLDKYDPNLSIALELGELFNDAVEAEIRFYK